MVRMKALHVICETKEGVVRRWHTRLDYEANQLNQYKEATRILNVDLMEKKAKLEMATYCCEGLAKANTNIMTELATLCEQMERAKAEAMVEYRTS